MSEQRKYSVGEIDGMRQALAMSYPCGQPFYQEERTREIEERLRTYMIGNVDPADVFAQCQKSIAAQQEAAIRQQEIYSRLTAAKEVR